MGRGTLEQALLLFVTVLVISPIPFAIAGAGFVWLPMVIGLLITAIGAIAVRVPSSPLYKKPFSRNR